MAEARVKRRLAAILAADVVGYSRFISSVSALLVELAERRGGAVSGLGAFFL